MISLNYICTEAFHKSNGIAIYDLDIGKAHKNPKGDRVGEKHKHYWSEIYRDKQAYEPLDIKASEEDPIKDWQQFCKEAAIRHDGVMRPLPGQQMDWFL